MSIAIPYYRVSTIRQGESGLGLEAQQMAVKDYASCHKLEIIAEFTEIESGKKNNRPVLHQALQKCNELKATLLIAKLDRLGRNVAFISKLMESNVDFVAVDNPKANKLIIHIIAAFAEYERDMISKRTKESLAAAKQRGVQLGKYGSTVLSKKNKEAADAFAMNLQPLLIKLSTEGFDTAQSIATELNRQRIPTFRNGSRWHLTSVYNLWSRIETLMHNP